MIKRADWETAYRGLIVAGCQRLGEPPTEEQLLAYSRGELQGEEAVRVQEALSCHPELARALAAPFPSPGESQPGDLDDLSDEALERDWKAIQARLLEASEPKALVSIPLWSLRLAVAVALAAVVGLFFWQSRMDVERLTREIAEPRLLPEHRLLLPDGTRGAEETPISLPAEAESFLLTLAVADHPPYPEYHVRIAEVNGKGERETWSASMPRPDGNVFEIWAPRAFLSSGAPHRLELHGVRDGQRHLLATYTIQLPAGMR
ncbi:MAG TPA: hypothetical protein VF756_05870 [Thermoanaerobaculia bacterium]